MQKNDLNCTDAIDSNFCMNIKLIFNSLSVHMRAHKTAPKTKIMAFSSLLYPFQV